MGLIPDLPEIPSIGGSLPNPADGPAGTMCRDMERQLDKGLGEMGKARNAIYMGLDSVKSALSDMVGQVATPVNDMNSALGDLNNAASNAMPSFPVGTDQLEDMLQKCGILKDSLPKMSGSALYDKYKDSIYVSFEDALKGIFDGISFPEFGISDMFRNLGKQLDFLDVGGILSGLDGYLNCLDSMCGSSVSDKIDYANNLVDEMGLTAEGSLDMDGLMDDAGISSAQKSNVTSVNDANASNDYDLKQATQNSGDSLVAEVKKFKDNLVGAVTKSNPFA